MHPTPSPSASALPSLSGRVVLITGANTGIGRVTALELAKAGAQVFVACRSAERTRPVIEQLRSASGNRSIEFLELDLGDFDSVRRCAQAFLDRGLPLHLLINNAGVAGARGMTRSGFEMAFGINHMGHFLLTQLLLDRLRKSAPARIVTVASRAHYRVGRFDWDALRRPTGIPGFTEYSLSKLCNVLFSAELGRRLAGSGVTTYSLHPGVVASDIWRTMPWPIRPLIKLRMITPEEGAKTSLYCATAPEAATQTGLYYNECAIKTPSELGRDETLAAELWKRSEDWVR